MTSLYSHAGESSFHSTESDYSDPDESQYGVYWKTESILSDLTASTSASVPHAPTTTTATIPITTSTSTPTKPVKRSTTVASLPSPSTSCAPSTESHLPAGRGAVRALRERKKGRILRSSSKAGQGASLSSSSSVVDPTTLAAVSKLEQRLRAKRDSHAVLADRTTPRANAAGIKGKAREVAGTIGEWTAPINGARAEESGD